MTALEPADDYRIVARRAGESIGYHFGVPFHEWRGFVRHLGADDPNLPTFTIDGIGTYRLGDNDRWELDPDDTTQAA